jgi:predicted RNase H-like nuclease (RuvC/YqgF family)
MSGHNYSGTGEYNYIGSTEEAMQVVKAIGLRDARIRELEEQVREMNREFNAKTAEQMITDRNRLIDRLSDQIEELEEQVREDRKALLMLRIAVARTAQGMGYETPHLSVLDKSYEELHQMADAEEHGWKSLLWGAVDELKSKLRT